jgi:GT2 family glycosyltransferase
MGAEAPQDVVELAQRRARARAEKDFAAADRLRDLIADAGWAVTDTPGGFELQPTTGDGPAGPVVADEVASVIEEPPTAEVSVQWVCEGWPEDIERALASFRANAGDRAVQYVVADVTGEPDGRWGDDVEVVSLVHGTGWAAARNAGLRRAAGSVVLAMDGSVEVTGDVFAPLVAALADDSVGVCGPFGVVTEDLREFDEAPGPGDCDAIEGYLMAFRREMLREAGPFDEKFKWYRTADIEWSFRAKDHGFRAVVVPVPVRKHEHRMWFETAPDQRARWSKRNYYRFLDRWRDRWDLVLSGKPEHEHHHD